MLGRSASTPQIPKQAQGYPPRQYSGATTGIASSVGYNIQRRHTLGTVSSAPAAAPILPSTSKPTTVKDIKSYFSKGYPLASVSSSQAQASSRPSQISAQNSKYPKLIGRTSATRSKAAPNGSSVSSFFTPRSQAKADPRKEELDQAEEAVVVKEERGVGVVLSLASSIGAKRRREPSAILSTKVGRKHRSLMGDIVHGIVAFTDKT